MNENIILLISHAEIAEVISFALIGKQVYSNIVAGFLNAREISGLICEI